MRGYRVYFHVDDATAARVMTGCVSTFLPDDIDYYGPTTPIIHVAMVELSLEVGCGGTYLVFDEYFPRRRVLCLRLGNAHQRANRWA